MNFYAESVVLLWTTAMRFGHAGVRAQHALPANDSDLENRHDLSSCVRILYRDGTSLINRSDKGRQQ
jgi:hypothetical protein